MARLSLPEESGGGGELTDAIEALRLAGKYCAAVPFAETALLGGWALAASGLPLPDGPLAFAVAPHAGELTLRDERKHWSVSGTLKDVAWAGIASALVVVAAQEAGDAVLCIPRSACEIRPAANLAGESRDEVRIGATLPRAAVSVASGVTADSAWRRGALTRAVLMSGALDRILELTLAYAKQRAQFGRTIIKFQAVQQELARLAGEAAIAKAASLTAAAHLDDDSVELYVAAAKVKAGEAAYTGAGIAHQLHAAIGVTDEYILHHSTLRLASWRSEYGNEAYWAARLGRLALDAGGSGLWSRITET
jgi:acyl-CoA dehydrogenase